MDESDHYIEKIRNLKILQLNKDRIKENKKIGWGGFGTVSDGSYLSLPVAIKKLDKCDLKVFFREISLYKQFKHLYVPNLYGLIEKQCDNPVIITELIKGHHIDKYVKKHKPCKIQMFIHLLDLATVIEYFHNNYLIHRDLKPSNILIDNKLNIKVIDFGISKETTNTITNTLAFGTPFYMAPENFICEGQTKSDNIRSDISNKIDIWALGCIIAELFSGSLPWGEKNENQVLGLLFLKKKFDISKKIKDIDIISLIECCTQINPLDRLDIAGVKKTMLRILSKYCENKSTLSEYLTKLQNNKNNTGHNLLIKLDNYLKEYKRCMERNPMTKIKLCKILYMYDGNKLFN